MLPDIAAVENIIREVAGTEVLPRFRNLKRHEITEKRPGDLVTIADEKAEATLDTKLRNLMPGSNVIGEEMATRDPSILQLLSTNDPVWVVDPVDGTQNFVYGKTCFAMIIAYILKRQTLAGWILEPYFDHLIWAVKGYGAWEKKHRLRIIDLVDVSEFRGSLSKRYREHLYARQIKEGVKIPKELTRYSCVGAEYADLARGQLDFARYMGNIKPWDHAAGVLIHSEAGGFSGYAETKEPYRPIAPNCGRDLILAPSHLTWRRLRKLTSI